MVGGGGGEVGWMRVQDDGRCRMKSEYNSGGEDENR